VCRKAAVHIFFQGLIAQVKPRIIVAVDVESSCESPRPTSDVKLQQVEEYVGEDDEGSVEVRGVSIYSRDRTMSAKARSRRYCLIASQYSAEPVLSKEHLS
jgi:hypothetical protein